MTENLYTQYANKYYNPNDDGKKPGDNENWESIQKGFSRIGSTQLETSGGLTLGKGTADETSVTAAELEEIKSPTQLETSGGLTLGKGTADETSVTAAELENLNHVVNGANGAIRLHRAVYGSQTYTNGFNNLRVNMTTTITGLKPLTRYYLTGYAYGLNSGPTNMFIGHIGPMTLQTNNDGDLIIESVIVNGIATAGFTDSLYVEYYYREVVV